MTSENKRPKQVQRRFLSKPQPLARTLDALFRGAPGAKRAQAVAALKRDWKSLAGPDLARLSEVEGVAPARGRAKGVLVLRAAPGAALLLQHEAPRIIERVNGFLGGDAVSRVKIAPGMLQGAKDKPFERPPSLDAEHPRAQAIAERADKLQSPRLAEALTRLGRSIGSR